MQFSGVTHGNWCNARTLPAKCKTCKAKVFFFSCDCGCKIYFASLGGKWPEHICISARVSTDVQHLPRGSTAELMRHHEEKKCKKEEALREQQYAESRRKVYGYEQQVAQMETQQKECLEAQDDAFTRDREVIRQERAARRKAKREARHRANKAILKDAELFNFKLASSALLSGQEYVPYVPELITSDRNAKRKAARARKAQEGIAMGYKNADNAQTAKERDMAQAEHVIEARNRENPIALGCKKK